MQNSTISNRHFCVHNMNSTDLCSCGAHTSLRKLEVKKCVQAEATWKMWNLSVPRAQSVTVVELKRWIFTPCQQLEAWRNAFLCDLRWVTPSEQIGICLNASWVHLQVIIHENNYKRGRYHRRWCVTFTDSRIKAAKNRHIGSRCKNSISWSSTTSAHTILTFFNPSERWLLVKRGKK